MWRSNRGNRGSDLRMCPYPNLTKKNTNEYVLNRSKVYDYEKKVPDLMRTMIKVGFFASMTGSDVSVEVEVVSSSALSSVSCDEMSLSLSLSREAGPNDGAACFAFT